MVIPDEGPSNPPLPEDAGPNERTLYDIYGFSSVLVRMTAEDWGTTSTTVSDLAREVRDVVRKLQGAQQPWTGPAADSAYATLTVLAGQLDIRAGEIDGIRKGLESAASAADTARQAYQGQVRSVSTDVDRSSYERTPARPPGGVPVPDGTVFDRAAYDAAVADKRAQRETAAAQVLATFHQEMTGAAKQMPVEAQENPVRITPTSGGGGSTPGGSPGGSVPPGGTYTGPTGTTGGPTHPPRNPPPVDPPVDPPVYHPPPPLPPTSIGDPPWPTPVDLDGGTTGGLTPGGPGSTDWAGTGSTGGSTSGPGVGGAGTLSGGMLAGGAAMLGKGVLGRLGGGALGAAGRGGLVAGGSGGTAGRAAGGASGRGAAGAGRSGLVAGGQGSASRGGGRGSGVRGAKGTGRYGVPKVGDGAKGAKGGRGAAGAGSGGRGTGRRRDGEAQDVEYLTHEDEETWFEGEEDATPPVWR